MSEPKKTAKKINLDQGSNVNENILSKPMSFMAFLVIYVFTFFTAFLRTISVFSRPNAHIFTERFWRGFIEKQKSSPIREFTWKSRLKTRETWNQMCSEKMPIDSVLWRENCFHHMYVRRVRILFVSDIEPVIHPIGQLLLSTHRDRFTSFLN